MDEKNKNVEEKFGLLVGEMAFWLLRKNLGLMDLTDKGLTEGQFTTSMVIRFFGRLTMTELSHILSVAMPTLTGIIDRLVKLGIVERTRDETDRRVVRVSLTDQGEQVIKEMHEKKHAHMKLLIGMLNETEQQELLRITQIMVQRLREEANKTSVEEYFNDIVSMHQKLCCEKK